MLSQGCSHIVVIFTARVIDYASKNTLALFISLYYHRLEKAMAPHSSPLAWKIPWMEEPGGLQSMGSLRVGLDWATSPSLFTFMHWRRKWQPTPVFLPGESQGQGAWWAAVYGVAQSWTRLKRLSSSSSISIIIGSQRVSWMGDREDLWMGLWIWGFG